MEVKDKILILNCTDHSDRNPGCRATMQGLRTVFLDFDLLELPLGYGYNYFRVSNGMEKIKFLYNHTFKKDKGLKVFQDYLSQVSIVIVNSEGTIHNSMLGARSLISLARIAIKKNKKVYFINGTHENLELEHLKTINKSSGCFVREMETLNYLSTNNIKSSLGYDLSLLSVPKIDNIPFEKSVLNKCVYTPGVLLSHSSRISDNDALQIITKHFNIIKKSFPSPIFLQIESKEDLLASHWLKLGGSLINAGEMDLNKVYSVLKSSDLVISGRYHILLFSMVMGTDVIPLQSNTKKIQGLFTTYVKKDIKINKLKKDFDITDKVITEINLKEIQNQIKSIYSNLVV